MLKRLYLRDAGGNLTVSGQRVRTRLLYRSSALNPLSTEDRVQLAALQLQHVVDLREAGVVKRAPDLFRAPAFTHLPIRLGAFETIKYRDVLLRRVDWQTLAHGRIYADVLEQNGEHLRHFLNLLVRDETLPLLIHCAAGKDRTGVFVALWQLALGVPRAEVVQNYMAIHPHLQAYFPASIRWALQKMRVPELSHTVIADYMNAMIDHLEEKYGNVETYLQAIGFIEVGRLREKFLE